MWENALITPNTTIVKAIEKIDQAGLQVALVVNEQGQLLGTVTDGDIRRAILKHQPLDDAVIKAMNPEPCYIYDSQPRESAILLMKNRKVRQIPVLDQYHRVVGLELADELLDPPGRDNWVLLMAGGLGKRLKPLTDYCPKPMLKIGGKPILETILESFITQGFKNFYIAVHYKAEMIMDHFGDGSDRGVEIRYLHEPEPLGTAGSLGLLPGKPPGPLLLMNGDLLTNVNYLQLLDYHNKNATDATLCIKEQYSHIPYGVVTIKGNRLQQIEEKPVQHLFVSAGLYVLNPELLNNIPDHTYYDMPDLFQTLLSSGREIAVFPIREYWTDIGRIDDFKKANHEFSEVFGC